MDYINHGLAWLLVTPWAVPAIVLGLLFWCGGIIARNHVRYHRGNNAALNARLRVLAPVFAAKSVDEAQACFASDFDDIDTAMRQEDGSAALPHAWLEYAETIIDPGATTIQSTSRPEDFFLHLGDETRVLAWWANLFVGFGLTFTFLGIIAALTATTDSIRDAGADGSRMSSALILLLSLTAAKFWTSIAGVLCSIVLRWFDRRWHSATTAKLSRMSHAIERGTSFVPAQRIAFDQLRELRQQSVALSEFSTKLAVGIADALGEKMQPVITGLSGLQTSLGEHLSPLADIRTSIDEFKNGSFDKIGEGLATAMNDHAGAQMQALAGALTDMTRNLGSVNDRLDGASGAASEQIAGAAREFSVASEAMTRAFAQLNGSIDGMAGRLAEQGEAAEQRGRERVAEDRASYDAMADNQRRVMADAGEAIRQASATSTEAMVGAVRDAVGGAMAESTTAIRHALDSFAGATAGIQQALDATRTQVTEMGERLSGSASDAATRNAEVLARAADALEAATTRASTGLGQAAEDASRRAAEASGRAIEAAFAAFGDRFTTASERLVGTLTTTAGRMETLSGAIERSTGAAGDHAGKLAEAGREAEAVGTMLGRAANDVSTAAGPIREATGSIREAVGQTREMLTRANEAGARYQTALETISGSIERTGSSAAEAWESYRTRFDGVDEALGRALDQIKSASAEHATTLNGEVGKMDKTLADAVDRLGAALEPLSDYAAALDDVRGRFQAAAE